LQSLSFETSVETEIDFPPAEEICSETFFNSSTFREASKTSAPAFAKAIAHAFPIPDDAPVMITTLPEKDFNLKV
jgi:hypothetical protein